MDPNETYLQIRQLVIKFNAGDNIDIDRLDALYSALKTWLNDGGFKPNKYKPATMDRALYIITTEYH